MALLLLSFGALFARTAQAAGLQVSPTMLALAQTERAGGFTLGNSGSQVLNAQARIYKWSQNDKGEDVLEPTTDLLVSPPILRLEPHSLQEIRIIRTQAASTDEAQYRLIIDELPAPSITPTKGLSLVLRYSLPIFVNAQERPPVQLQWKASNTAEGKTLLTIYNPQKERAQIARIWIQAPDQAPMDLSHGLFAYVLPGKTVQRVVDISLTRLKAASASIKAMVNDHESSVQLGD